jgi:hypothetical protein
MSSHFNYEIDERNLRVKLKDMSIPYREEAWVQFETYSDGCKNTYKTSSLPRINLNINRNLILPVLFGAGIILFSMLLFNFVSISNKPAGKAELVKTTPAPEVREPQPEPKKIIPVLSDTLKVPEAKTDSSQVPPVSVAIATVAPVATVQPKEESIASQIPVETLVPKDSWVLLSNASIYKDPNIKSEVIGGSPANKMVSAIEETNYFIKISFNKNSQTETGYILKSIVRKNHGQQLTSSAAKKPRGRKPEVLESHQAPATLPTSSSDQREPELK